MAATPDWQTTHATSFPTQDGRTATAKLQQRPEVAPAVQPLPLLALPVVQWSMSDPRGLGVQSRSCELRLYADPLSLLDLVEEAGPETLRLVIEVEAAGAPAMQLFKGGIRPVAVKRGLVRQRRAFAVRFVQGATAAGKVSVPGVEPDAAVTAWTRATTLAALVASSLDPSAADGGGIAWAHPWRSQARDGESGTPVSFLHTVEVDEGALVGQTRESVMQGVCETALLSVGHSITLSRWVAQHVLAGASGAAVALTSGSGASAGDVPAQALTRLDEGTIEGAVVRSVRVTSAPVEALSAEDAPRSAGGETQLYDSVGPVRDYPGVAGAAAEAGLALRLPWASEIGGELPGPGLPLPPPLWASAMVVDRVPHRAVGQVWGMPSLPAGTCLQIEAAVAAELYAWLGRTPARRRIATRVEGYADPCRAWIMGRPEPNGTVTAGVVWRGVEGQWDVAAALSEITAVEMFVPGETAASVEPWHTLDAARTDRTWSLAPRANRRLAGLSIACERYDDFNEVWTRITWTRGGSAFILYPLAGTSWENYEPEQLLVGLSAAQAPAGTYIRWILVDGAGTTVAMSPLDFL